MGQPYVYKATLSRVYGLTPAMIAELGAPDRHSVNPYHPDGPPACLYLVDRVEAWVEGNKDRVEKARESRAKRSEAAKAAHDQKRAERRRREEESVRSLAVEVRSPLPGTLLQDARRCYPFQGHADCLLEKGLHAYVRHRLTNYETLLHQLYKHEFAAELYPLARERVDEVVGRALEAWRGSEGTAFVSSGTTVEHLKTEKWK